jgi:hypothetical protein
MLAANSQTACLSIPEMWIVFLAFSSALTSIPAGISTSTL